MARILEISDNFNRADNASIGANWNVVEGTIAILSNEADITTSTSAALHNTTLSTTAQYVKIKVASGFTTAGTRPILYLRSDSTAANAYAMQYRADTDDILVYRKVSGSFNLAASLSYSGTYANGDTIEAEIEDNGSSDPVIKVFVNGTQADTWTDTDAAAILTGGYVGFRDSTANATFDDFEAGILGEAATATVLRVNIGQTGTGVRII